MNTKSPTLPADQTFGYDDHAEVWHRIASQDTDDYGHWFSYGKMPAPSIALCGRGDDEDTWRADETKATLDAADDYCAKCVDRDSEDGSPDPDSCIHQPNELTGRPYSAECSMCEADLIWSHNAHAFVLA